MNETIVLGVTGGIAAFKAAQLTSDLIKKGYDVEIIMTQNATEFIAPLTFESLTKHNVMVSTFEKVVNRSVAHISLAKRASLFVIVPATANVIAKAAHGIADDMLTTTFLAADCPKLICPAMNTNMYVNPITQNNIAICKSYGMHFLEPANGFLACGDSGKGKLAAIDDILEKIEQLLHPKKLLQDLHVLITAGPTQEALDPVRFISNHSSGKMGYALAQQAKDMGGMVTLISGPVSLPRPQGIEIIDVVSAQDMMNAVKAVYKDQDIIIKAAAVGDYRMDHIEEQKIKKDKDEFQITLKKNPDILAYLGEHKNPNQVLCGFAMETQNLEAQAKKKMEQKCCDMLVANNLKTEGAGFQTDTNVATIFTSQMQKALPKMSKEALAQIILETAYELYLEKGGKASC